MKASLNLQRISADFILCPYAFICPSFLVDLVTYGNLKSKSIASANTSEHLIYVLQMFLHNEKCHSRQ